MLKIKISNAITVEKNLPFEVRDALDSRLVFPNPEYIEKLEKGYWVGDTPKKISLIGFTTEGLLSIPRGFINQFFSILDRHGVAYTIEDATRALPEIPFTFIGHLHDFQQEAVEEVLRHRFGVINAPTGSGKTIMALYLIANRKQPALVICHTKELMYQWRDRAMQFLGLPEDEIGLIGDGRKDTGKKLTIGIVNSVYKMANELKNHTGFLIVDECHRAPARTFTEAVTAFDSKYMLGLSATPYRRDGLTKLIYYHLGDKCYGIEPQMLQETNKIMRPHLMTIETGFNYFYEDNYQEMLTDITQDNKRNALIANTVSQANGNGISLVISDRKEHCRALFDLLKENHPTEILTGDMSSKDRKKIIEKLNTGCAKILVATAQLIGEGFDLPPLERIFLATPIKFTGRVIQYIGRILRIAEGKGQATIYDFIDKPGVLKASFYTRRKAYRDLGVIENEL